MLKWALEFRAVTIIAFVCLFLLSFVLVPFIGRDFFPQVDAGQFRLHVTTPAGTRIEEAEVTFGAVEDYIRQVVPKDELKIVIDNIGLPVGGVNLAFSDSATIGSTDGEIQVALNSNHKTPGVDLHQAAAAGTACEVSRSGLFLPTGGHREPDFELRFACPYRLTGDGRVRPRTSSWRTRSRARCPRFPVPWT